MRSGQLDALQHTRAIKGHPFDAIDMGFGLLTAISGSPLAFLLTGAQYFARRSAWVSTALLEALELPPALEDSRLLRGLLPGTAKLLPASTDGGMLEAAQDAPATQQRAQLLTTEQWRDALEESPHLLIYGPSKAGKSTLAQAVVAMFRGCEYVVIDPQPNKPGERKWGGIDFITLDEQGDEYASIKSALLRIKAEDDRRRRTMRQQTHAPLVVIVDEVLALVGALGLIVNEEGKKEPRMAHFIRTMGYSARHRNIKIILIGQGKNLADLGLNSGTARNNYALVRAARNAATNVRSAYIEADGEEQPIDIARVPALANVAAGRARVWLAHGELLAPSASADAEFLSALLAAAPSGTRSANVPADRNQVPNVVPASGSQVPSVPAVPVPAAEVAKIAQMLAQNSPSKVVKLLDGYHPRKYDEYKAKVDAVLAMLGNNPCPIDPDRPDTDEGVPPAFHIR